MRLNAAVILQARMNSRRLPGKVQALIGGRTVLARCLARLLQASPVPVVLATTDRLEDDVLEAEAERLGVRTYRGPSADVLTRFIQAARMLGVDYVVRATADNPAVDMAAPGRVLSVMASTGADHVTERDLPYGAAVEAVSVDALLRASDLADDPSDREHVTTLIRRDQDRFHAIERPAPEVLRRPELRLTVDTPDDLVYMRRVLGAVEHANDEVPLAAIIAAAGPLSLSGTAG